MVTAENTDEAVHVCGSLVRNYTASPKMLFNKDSRIKRHMDIHGSECVSTVFHQLG